MSKLKEYMKNLSKLKETIQCFNQHLKVFRLTCDDTSLKFRIEHQNYVEYPTIDCRKGLKDARHDLTLINNWLETHDLKGD